MDAWNLMLVCEFCDPFHDLSIGLSRGVVLASRDLLGFVPKRVIRRPVARQSPGGERAIRNHPDLLLAAERQHLPLLFAVDQVQVILHRDKAWPAMLLGDVQRLLELPREHGGGTDVPSLPCLNDVI